MKYYAIPGRTLHLGTSGDNHAIQVYFDITDWNTMWPNGSAVVLVTQSSTYSQQLTKITENEHTYAVWTITTLSSLGLRQGQAMVKYSWDHDASASTTDYIAQSRIYNFVIDKAITLSSDSVAYDADGMPL